MTEPTFFVKLIFDKFEETAHTETYVIATRYANVVKRELVKYELKTEGIDPD